MRRAVDAQAQDIQRVETLRQQQLLTQVRAMSSRSSLTALVAESRRKPLKHHHVDDSEVRAHDQASRDARHELRELESIGPGQLLCEALDEAADKMIEESIDMVADGFFESVEDLSGAVIERIDETVGDIACDLIHFARLD